MTDVRIWSLLGGVVLLATGCPGRSQCPRPVCPRAPAPTSYLMNLDEPQRTQQRIVVARVALAAGTVLRTSLLTARDQPPNLRWAGHLRPVDLVHFAGRRLQRAVAAGEPIRRSDLEGGGARAAGASGFLPKGARSVSVRVDWVGGRGTWVKPGDHVDVGMVRKGARGVRPGLVILMQNARVLMASSYPEGPTRPRGLWVSVLALPREAHGLALAQRLGRIVLFPRSARAGRTVVYPPVTLKDLENPAFWRRLQKQRQRTIQQRQAADDPGIRVK